jgi:hypothetical protein
MATKKFNIVSSNPNSKGGFVTKLTNSVTVPTIFGDKTKSETYYVSGSLQMTIGESVDLDLDAWSIVTYPFTNPDTGEVIDLKWLTLK